MMPMHTTSRFNVTPQKPMAKPTAVTNGQNVAGGGWSGRGWLNPVGSCAGAVGDIGRCSFGVESSIRHVRCNLDVYCTIAGDDLAGLPESSVSSSDSPNHAPSRMRIALA